VDLRLLGPIEARLDDRPIELGPRKQRAVLAMLALDLGRTVSADRLVEGLWGDEPPSSAPKMVQLYVSHLRRLLDGNGARIVTRGRGYELQLSDGGVDAVQAERLLADSRGREALALWRGDPLADVADEPFAAPEIRRLGELRLQASESAIDADLAAGRHAQVIGELDALVGEQPLREHLHAQRMLALYRSGRQADALAAYGDARTALVGQIGVEPGTELRELQKQILGQDPALDAPPPRPPARPRDEPPRPPPRRARALVVAAAGVLLAGVIAFGVIRVLEPEGLPGIDENAVGLIDPDGGRITKQYGVGRGPGAVATGGGSVWVANRLDGTVSRIDRDRGQVVTIPVGGAPAALAFGAGSLWVADGDVRSVAQVDPGANKVEQRVAVGNAPRAIAVAAGALWVASGVDGGVRRIDLDRGRATRSIVVGANPTSMVAGAGALWVASEESGTVTRLDPRTGAIVSAISVGNGPSAVTAGEGGVWVVNRHDGTLSRIDPERDVVAWTVRVGSDPTAVAAGEGSVWVAGGEEGTVARVDPDRPHVVERVRTGGSPAAVAVAHGSVWAAAAPAQAAHRGGTLRVRVAVGDPPAVSVDWVGPYGFDWSTAFVTSLAYDGLVAYRRVGGVAGSTLVGALATRAPPPSRDGRSYSFTLRPGIRFSDGTPVRPEDFRASMERYLRVTRDRYPPFFERIAGARRCVRRPAACDLSAGIRTDARTRTIMIRLTRPDRELLHKLTLPFAFVVPARTPVRPLGDRPPPGTGPYRIARWNELRGGTFERNPHFRSESRPAGFADQIEVTARSDADVDRDIAAVQRGAADYAVIANPFRSYVRPERLRALVAQSPGQVHSNPMPSTDWMFMNVTRRPFDDLRVRRALNLAADRARLVRLAGGRQLAVATCQIIPTAFPGHEPYCPYTTDPAPGRGWAAPDVVQARRLIRRSGRSGERVVVRIPEFQRPVGRYFAGLLDALGFRATLEVLGEDYFSRIYDRRSQTQMGFVGWSLDFVSPSSFIEPNFACRSRADRQLENASHTCDPRLARLVGRALAAPAPEAVRTWAAADRRVTDLAAAVPMTNRRAVVLVSKRVGNVQHHPQWFTLLDQLWVR